MLLSLVLGGSSQQVMKTLGKGSKKVRMKNGLCTSAGVVVAPSKSVAGVIPRKGHLPKAMKKHEGRKTDAWMDDFR